MSSLSGLSSATKTLSGVVDLAADTATINKISGIQVVSAKELTAEKVTVSGNVSSANISVLEATVATNTTDIATIETSTATNSANIATLQSSTATNTANIATLQTSTATNTANIATLQTSTATNTSGISTNTSSVATLQTKTQNLTASAGSSAFTGNLTVGNLALKPDSKGEAALSNCTTLGTEETKTYAYYADFQFTGATTNGYTCDCSSYSTLWAGTAGGWGAFGTGSNYWDSNATYNPNGSAGASPYIKYGQNDASTSYGEWVAVYLPTEVMLTSVSFYNLESHALNHTNKSVSCFYRSLNSPWTYLAGSVSNLSGTPQTVSFNLTTHRPVKLFIFQVTSVQNYSGGSNHRASVKNIRLYGYPVPVYTKNICIPNSLSVGYVTNSTLETVNSLSVNGDCTVNGTLKVKNVEVEGTTTFSNLPAWLPDCTLPSSSFSYNEANDKGYFTFAGGFCVQWGWLPDSSPQNWDYLKPLTYVYGAVCQRTSLNSRSATASATEVIGLTTTRLSVDSAYGSGDKSSCFVVVWGKV